MGKVDTYTVKEVLLRVISGARLINRNDIYYLQVFRKGEIRIDTKIGSALVNGGVVVEDGIDLEKRTTYYVCKFERQISDSVPNKKKEIRVFVMHLWKSKRLGVSFDKAGNTLEAFDDYLASLLYLMIKKEFKKWHEERQKYLREIEDL